MMMIVFFVLSTLSGAFLIADVSAICTGSEPAAIEACFQQHGIVGTLYTTGPSTAGDPLSWYNIYCPNKEDIRSCVNNVVADCDDSMGTGLFDGTSMLNSLECACCNMHVMAELDNINLSWGDCLHITEPFNHSYAWMDSNWDTYCQHIDSKIACEKQALSTRCSSKTSTFMAKWLDSRVHTKCKSRLSITDICKTGSDSTPSVNTRCTGLEPQAVESCFQAFAGIPATLYTGGAPGGDTMAWYNSYCPNKAAIRVCVENVIGRCDDSMGTGHWDANSLIDSLDCACCNLYVLAEESTIGNSLGSCSVAEPFAHNYTWTDQEWRTYCQYIKTKITCEKSAVTGNCSPTTASFISKWLDTRVHQKCKKVLKITSTCAGSSSVQIYTWLLAVCIGLSLKIQLQLPE